ncbi:hypothetical protein CPB84DRAFT_1744950 [Gymnopilus junonius]|uniref:Uncharacterized protein n=1 Tax=Gymnopilus junonius TaxID=109634 RepID=A0A9P5TQ82_GYMJU|nr:hypothetical protein CPB84DRAFT_1744950 [Gymnopilus junonius]
MLPMQSLLDNGLIKTSKREGSIYQRLDQEHKEGRKLCTGTVISYRILSDPMIKERSTRIFISSTTNVGWRSLEERKRGPRIRRGIFANWHPFMWEKKDSEGKKDEQVSLGEGSPVEGDVFAHSGSDLPSCKKTLGASTGAQGILQTLDSEEGKKEERL